MNPADPKLTHAAAELVHDSPIIACRFDPEGRYLFAAAQDCTVQQFEVATGKKLSGQEFDSWVRAIGFSADGQTVYTGGYDGRLLWHETEPKSESPKPLRTVDAHNGWIRALAVSPDGQLIATAGNDNLVKLWNAENGECVRELAGHESHVYNVAFHPQGTDLVSCDLKGVVKHWTVADGAEQREVKVEELHKYDTTFHADMGGARSIAFNGDGTRLALGGITKVTNAFAGVGVAAVAVIDWEAGKQVQFHRPKEELRGATWGLEYHPEGFLIAAVGGGSGGFFYFYKEDTANPFHEFKLPKAARDMHMHPDKLQLAVAHFDNMVRIYRMDKKAEPEKK